MFFYISAVIISTFIFIILPLLFIGLVFFVFKKKTNSQLAIIVSFTLLVIFFFFIVTNFYPRESFFRDNFEENTELELPNSATLVNSIGKNTIYNFGDYNISYVYQLSRTDCKYLYSKLLEKGFYNSEVYLETVENATLINAIPKHKCKNILTKDFGFKNYDVLFLDDNKTIIFNSNKW